MRRRVASAAAAASFSAALTDSRVLASDTAAASCDTQTPVRTGASRVEVSGLEFVPGPLLGPPPRPALPAESKGRAIQPRSPRIGRQGNHKASGKGRERRRASADSARISAVASAAASPARSASAARNAAAACTASAQQVSSRPAAGNGGALTSAAALASERPVSSAAPSFASPSASARLSATARSSLSS